jgi:hypothetical protein
MGDPQVPGPTDNSAFNLLRNLYVYQEEQKLELALKQAESDREHTVQDVSGQVFERED